MSKERLDGGNAFPCVTDDDKNEHLTVSYGMSLRDWFAGMALQGNLACQSIELGYYDGDRAMQKAAQEAYATADAMLKEREI